ncbi:beta-ketoacyl-[acyl-carrier-protein] synthase II [Spirochaetia bacterium]|nr:beta-ketoacyl-[acyl-carrier-protein] synthase II [Spirochaetia bacterium]
MGIYLSPPGLVCCAGNNRDQVFEAAIRGDQGGIKPVCLFGGKTFPVGRIDAVKLSAPGTYTTETRLIRIADAALEQILPQVEQVLAAYGSSRIAVCVGSCDNGSEGSLRAHGAYFSGGAFPADYELRFQGAGFPAEYIAHKFGLSGPVLAVSTACASSAGAVIKGAEFIRAGLCDAVIAGGADLASELALAGFDSLEALSGAVCNPFSKNRQGITLGDGAAFFVMAADKSLFRENGGGIELLGAGESADAFHMTAPRSDGSGAIRAMEAALADAGVNAADVDYINLHGTGTRLNDSMEALAVAAVFRDSLPPVSSTKPITGHTLGAAGALELALCWMLLSRDSRNAALPVHCWDGVYDEELPRLRFAGKEAVALSGAPQICMSNSFAFGGCNVSLLLGRDYGKG